MSSSSHKKKKTKITSHQSSISTVDRISDLPDPILCHILNSFPTKFAATTSVLSKRWKELWLSVPALKFDSRGFKTCRLLRLGVHSTLNKRDIIQSFSLKYHKILSCEQKDVNKFVDLILQRGIQNLYLNPSKYACILIALPVSILSCRTLKVLKLTNITVKSIFDVVDLPSLKTLHLKKIIFERYKNLVSLLLSCPILEDLETTSCSIVDIHQVRFMIIPTVLPNLVKARISELEIPLCTVSKAKILCVVELEMFTCCTTQLLMFQNLTCLELHFDHQLWNPRWTWLLGMLEFSPKLQTLIIKDNDVLDEANDECWNLPPPVPECLLSQLKTCRIRNYKGKKYDLEFAKYIIENSKVLDIMTINSACSLDTKAKTRLSKRLSSCTRGSATFKLLFD